jgi:hypothetical protein
MISDQHIEWIAFLRQEAGNRPLMLFLTLLLVFAVAGARTKASAELRRPLSEGLVALAVLGIAVYVTLALWYLVYPQYSDAAEPTIAAVAWVFERGRPLYHDINSAERYSHIYGPMAFAIPGWSLEWFGPGILASKIPGTAAGLLSLSITFALAFVASGRRGALLVTGLFAGLCLMFQNVSFWIRPDSLQLLSAAVALLAVVRIRSSYLAGIVLGLATGVLVNLKMTGPLYVIPAVAVALAERRIAPLVVALPTAIVVAAAPFVLYDNVSYANYLQWTALSAHNGLLFSALKQNIEWALFLLVPLVPALVKPPDSAVERWLPVSLAAAIAVVVLAASKPGAGAYHLLPFLPALAYAMSLMLRWTPSDPHTARHRRLGIAAYLIAVVVVASLQIVYFAWSATRTPGRRLAEDLTRFAALHQSERIEMGYSADDGAFAYVRPILVFRTGAYLLDAPAIQEHQMSGLELPRATFDAIQRCDVDSWLIPRGATPFSSRNAYPSTGHAPLFPDAFRAIFNATYHRVETTNYFDVWSCREHRR